MEEQARWSYNSTIWRTFAVDDGQGPVFIEEENDICSKGTMAIVLSMASKVVKVYHLYLALFRSQNPKCKIF